MQGGHLDAREYDTKAHPMQMDGLLLFTAAQGGGSDSEQDPLEEVVRGKTVEHR